MTDTYTREDPGCLSLPEGLADSRDFKAEEVIQLDLSVQLPKTFSLGKRVRTTNYQNGWGSCTANATSHGVQVLSVIKEGKEPHGSNIITPDRKDLRTNMGHKLDDKNDSGDYVEIAVSTALKSGIKNEEGGVSTYDGYSTQEWARTQKGIETIKRYIYNNNPIVWCIKGNKNTWSELSAGQLRTFVPVGNRTGGHAIACVGWDEGGLWFLNSWKPNDGKGYKSRFYVPYIKMIECGTMFNRRYRPLFNKNQIIHDPEYLKRKANAKLALEALKKVYKDETPQIQRVIESLSTGLRNHYPELNDELPINS